jgi:hypothetical protein
MFGDVIPQFHESCKWRFLLYSSGTFLGGFFQIPLDLVVKSQAIDMAEIHYHESGDQTPSQCCVETGSQGLSSSPHPRLIGLPLNPMERANS